MKILQDTLREEFGKRTIAETELRKIYGISAEIRQKCEFEIGN